MATWRTAFLLIVAALGMQVGAPDPATPDPKTPRPIAAADTLFIEDMTWMEVRDALAEGKDTVIVSTGGIEQNGPYLAANKHNIILRAMTDAIARKMGNTLIAPIIGFVPEGNIDPPTIHMKYPSTVSLSEKTYLALLTEVCECYKTHGFKRIILIGDSGGNQLGLKNVAKILKSKWGNRGPKIHFIPEYYTSYEPAMEWLKQQGIDQSKSEGLHDDFVITAIMMTVDPNSVRMKERIAAKKFSINGVELAPAEKTIEWGKKVIDYRADLTIDVIKKAIAKEGR